MTPNEFKRLRTQVDLTQAQLSEALGVRANTVARWERGELRIAEPAARLLRLLASNPSALRSLVRESTEVAR